MDVRIEESVASIFSPLLSSLDKGEVEEIIRLVSACLRIQLKEFQRVKTRQEFLELVYSNLSLPLMMHIFKRKDSSGGLQRFKRDIKNLLGTAGKEEGTEPESEPSSLPPSDSPSSEVPKEEPPGSG